MKSQIPNPIKNKLLQFQKKHSIILTEWESLKKDAKGQLFIKYCKKEYYDKCDPAYCTFYHSGECNYPAAIRELDFITEIK